MHQAADAQSQKKGNKWGPVQIKSLDPGSDKDRWGSHDRRLIRKTKNQGSQTKQRGWKNGNRLLTFLIILCVLDAEKMVLLFLNLTSFIAVRWHNVTMHGDITFLIIHVCILDCQWGTYGGYFPFPLNFSFYKIFLLNPFHIANLCVRDIGGKERRQVQVHFFKVHVFFLNLLDYLLFFFFLFFNSLMKMWYLRSVCFVIWNPKECDCAFVTD